MVNRFIRHSSSQHVTQARSAARFLSNLIREHGLLDKPELAVILGSGQGNFAKTLAVELKVPFDSIPHFPLPSVAGHPGSFVLARLRRRSVICLEGRPHHYEGLSMNKVTFPVRVLGILGIRHLIVTNAAGGVNRRFSPGDFMLISDHISSFLPNPLVGVNWEDFGSRFPDMSQCYSLRLRQLARRCAKRLNIKLREGTYVAVSGPSYETPAEIGMLRQMGGDAVGMSTVPEIIVARHMGIECLGISVITNQAAGLSKVPLSHDEVLSTAERRTPALFKLLKCLCGEIVKAE